jgi:hypothetical protein
MKKLNTQVFEPKSCTRSQTVILVPFYDGTKEQLLPHIRMLNQLGFRVLSFDLSMKGWGQFPISQDPRTKKAYIGIKHLWAQRIADVLDEVPGQKILFTLSNPSSCAIEAMSLRKKNDVELMICDGGPFDMMWECGENLLEHYYEVKNFLFRKFLNVSLYWLWSPEHHKSLHETLSKLPNGFPVLSIRAGLDELVPPKAIEAAFAGHSQIQLEVFDLPDCKHLKGLKDHPAEYKKRVEDFLKRQLAP